jgi:hypothetical protein
MRPLFLLTAALPFACTTAVVAQTVRVIDMIPQSVSAETNQDSEPNLTVNPLNPLQIAGTAFTPDPGGSGNTPIYISADGGQTWAMNVDDPDANNDITLRFGRDSNVLYVGTLSGGTFHILRTSNYASSTLMTELLLPARSNEDQPYVETFSSIGGILPDNDLLFIGNNNFNPGADTATIDYSTNPATSPPPSGLETCEISASPSTWTTGPQDLPPTRMAIHPDGTVYGAYLPLDSSLNASVVVTRDDNFAVSPPCFQSLTDTGGHGPGQGVVTGVANGWAASGWSFPYMGSERISSSLSIAVDPRDSSTVYIAWGDGSTGPGWTIHIRKSTTSGQSWSTSDLETISGATNPSLAVNSQGTIGLLFQQLSGSNWRTHVQLSTNGFTSVTTDFLLALTPDPSGNEYQFDPSIGDYDHLLVNGKNFYGIFSAVNVPLKANFPQDVAYNRYADFSTGVLYADAAHTTPVSPSVDPFFFEVQPLAADKDYYVRDWTDNATAYDNGVEPSTHADFFTTSDVWNKASNAAGAFNANNQPQSDPAQAGTGSAGTNYAFARISRNKTGSSAAISAHYYISPFGVGSNFIDAGTAPDVVTNFASAASQHVTSGYAWQLDPTSSNHVCLAVEITGPNDPPMTPLLLGKAPGWGAGNSDLLVLEDNNKAQRNLSVDHSLAGEWSTGYALVHNAALYARDVVLAYSSESGELAIGSTIGVVGGQQTRLAKSGSITIPIMQPGDNALVAVRLRTPQSGMTAVRVFETLNGRALNGFGIGVAPSSERDVFAQLLRYHAQVYTRLAAIAGRTPTPTIAHLPALASQSNTGAAYLQVLRSLITEARSNESTVTSVLPDLGSIRQQIGTSASLDALQATATAGAIADTAAAHLSYLNLLDATTTLAQKRQGDVADILQTVSLQRVAVIKPGKSLSACGARIASASAAFTNGYQSRRLGASAYPNYVRKLLECFASDAQGNTPMLAATAEMRQVLGSPAALQRAQRSYILAGMQ